MAGLLRGHCLHLAGQRHAVLRLTPNSEVGGDVLSRLGHGVHAVLLFHQFIDEAPADGGVVDRVAAAEGAVHLGHDKRGAAHALHAAGNHQAGLAGADGAGGGADRVQPRAAQAVDGGPRHVNRQAGQQAAHVRHIAVVFAGLVGTAKQHITDSRPVHLRVARH